MADDERKPDLIARVYLVEHGYQIEIVDGDGRLMADRARDFSGHYKLPKLKVAAVAAMAWGLRQLEATVRKMDL